MGDHSAETSEQFQKCLDDEKYARDHFLGGRILDLDEESLSWILDHIDCFVSQSRGNKSVGEVYLYPYSIHGHANEVWDKVGLAVGNLQALKTLYFSNFWALDIDSFGDDDDDDQVVPNLDWGELACVLKHIRQMVEVDVVNSDAWAAWAVGEVQALARAIRGHPTIRKFDCGNNLSYEASDTLYSALATLPALETVKLSSIPEDEFNLANPQSLTELLRSPSLRSVCFSGFYFTSALCQATANALMEGTAFTRLEFDNCSFYTEGSAASMASGLSRNTSVSHIEVVSPLDQALCSALATALPSNSTLRCLILQRNVHDDDHDLSRVFLALGNNTGLKTLTIDYFGLMKESLCIAIKDGLGQNETLESLELANIVVRDDNIALWCRAFSFLRTNKALKYLVLDVHYGVTESCISAFRIDIAAMLEENASLESLSILDFHEIKTENYAAVVTALQHNRTLKTFLFHSSTIELTDDEEKHMVKILKKNYALESIPEIDLEDEAGDINAILRLNAAGRRYLIENGSSISKGVEVLSRVNDDIHCVFFHLLENPRLCDRSAVEIVSTGESNSNPSVRSGSGKREQASVQKSRESRRRLA
jgi:hypothetical protein